jgi:hypothetical protein
LIDRNSLWDKWYIPERDLYVKKKPPPKFRYRNTQSGVTLPKTIVDNYHLTEEDELHLMETEEGVVLTPFNPRFAEWAKAYDLTNRKYKNVLKALVK